jgi:cytoskeletal protein RodZ
MDEIINCGEWLRQTREQKGLTLRDVEKGTSIRLAYLKAIEEGQIDGTITPVYANGFIRQYAQFLGTDMALLSDQFPSVFRPQPIAAEFAYGIGTLEMRGAPHGGVRMIPNWLTIAIVVGGALALYWAWTLFF